MHASVQAAVDADQATDRRQGRDAAGGQDEHVVRHPGAVGELDLPLHRVHVDHPGAEAQVDGVVQRQRERVAVVGALEQGGEQDPVVRRVRLVAEQGDRSAGPGELVGQPSGGHAGTHDDRVEGVVTSAPRRRRP